MAFHLTHYEVGRHVYLADRECVIEVLVEEDNEALVRDVQSDTRFRAQLEQLAPAPKRGSADHDPVLGANDASEDDEAMALPKPYEGEDEGVDIDVAALTEEENALAEERYEAIKGLLAIERPTGADFAKAAKLTGYSEATLRRYLKAFQESGDKLSLLPKKSGPRSGGIKLSPQQHYIVQKCIKGFLSTNRSSIAKVHARVTEMCEASGVKPPAYSTIKRRIDCLPKAEVLRAQGLGDEADKYYAPAVGGEIVCTPMSLVQIDHTCADIILVDRLTRQPVGRPWVSLAIDVYSRMPVGLYVSFDAPNAGSVGLCLQNAMFEKGDYLRRLGIEEDNPAYGLIGTVHADNAREFRSRAMKHGCARHNIDIRFRPVKNPKYGGHIERLMGVLAKETASLPGKTGADIKKRRGLNPDADAALTLEEYEACLADYFFIIYPDTPHSGIKTTPAYRWHAGLIGDANAGGVCEAFAPRIPLTGDQKRALAIDLLPYKERTVQTYGVINQYITYHAPVLNPLIRENRLRRSDERQKYIVRYDPRDISQVFFYDHHTKIHHVLPATRHDLPPFSLWEMRRVHNEMQARGEDHKDEARFAAAMARHRERIEDAIKNTKAAKISRRLNENVRKAETAHDENRVLFAGASVLPTTGAPCVEHLTAEAAAYEQLQPTAPSNRFFGED